MLGCCTLGASEVSPPVTLFVLSGEFAGGLSFAHPVADDALLPLLGVALLPPVCAAPVLTSVDCLCNRRSLAFSFGAVAYLLPRFLNR